MEDVFVFTEAVRCGRIARMALRSFQKHHPGVPVHVFGLRSDRAELGDTDVVFHPLDGWERTRNPLEAARRRLVGRGIARDFDRGHRGTAGVWAHVIQTRPERYVVHFDSDVVFRAEALSDLTRELSSGYALVGPPRPYAHNPNGRDDVRHLPDVTQTLFVGFDRTLVGRHSRAELTSMCEGKFNPLGFSVIDFFDPVAFEIIANGGRVLHLDPADYGGVGLDGRYSGDPAGYPGVDMGSKLIHFAAVGSGLNFYEHPERIRGVPATYVEYALARYELYARVFFGEELGIGSEHARTHAPELLRITDWY